MKETVLVSIVLPVYNGERYLPSAIDSVLAQTYLNWELLVIDDGSSDRSAVICDHYATLDSRIIVFHQPNRGVNFARAKGVENAKGLFLTFLDADDIFTIDALSLMLQSFSSEVDVVSCGTKERLLDKNEFIAELWKGALAPGICTKMFRTDIYKQIDYKMDPRLVMGEDLLLNSMYALKSNQVKILPRRVYIINRNNEESVTKTFKHNWEYEKFFFNKVEDLFLKKCVELESYEQIKYLVNKSSLNAMKYVMLQGGAIDYSDDWFKTIRAYFMKNKGELGLSEKLIFRIRNHKLYAKLIKTYLGLVAKIR